MIDRKRSSETLLASAGSHPQQGYRPDIDGLRAVAVTIVLLFHIATVLPGGIVQHFLGGFVGVDVFFVISGYLITTIVRVQLGREGFRFRDFYARRAKRILPALTVVILATSFFAARYMFPTELAQFGASVIAAALSFSNIYFWLDTGYFTGPAESKLLLHTWSLAVEEQFYLFWPFLLVQAYRRPRLPFGWLLAVVGLSSFAISAVLIAWAPESAFYLVFSRVWELLIGAGLTLRFFSLPLRRPVREFMATGGLLCIIAATLLYRPETPFPAWAALPPCLGAALIIWSGATGTTVVRKFLELRPIVFTGLISYSLYLWHWPVIALQKATSLLPGGDAGKAVKVEVILLSVALAILSWRYIERPFRSGSIGPRTALRMAGVACIGLALVGVGLRAGFGTRLTPQEMKVASFLDYAGSHELTHCQLPPHGEASEAAFADCMPSTPSEPSVLLLGDSHANSLVPGLLASYPHLNLIRLTGSGCKPAPGDAGSEMCDSLLRFAEQEILSKRRLSAIMLADRWEERDIEPLTAYIARLKKLDVPIILFGPLVQYDQALPRLMVNARLKGDPDLVAQHRLNLSELDSDLRRVAQAEHIEYVSLQKAMCRGGTCTFRLPDGDPLQFDYGHLTAEGSRFVVRLLKDEQTMPILDELNRQSRPSSAETGSSQAQDVPLGPTPTR